MPIANCRVVADCKRNSGELTELIELWSVASGKASDEMTVNLLEVSRQFGKQYKIMADLLLPSVWSATDISLLQLGLAGALSRYFAIAIDEIIVITHIIESGRVVESGEEVSW
ncbi:hypothetical protein [Psychromonas sp.]|uniref:hypothetical protein n=1 Tax=Psychromonas sp. TaxID=1884585 RepID=UPI003565E144